MNISDSVHHTIQLKPKHFESFLVNNDYGNAGSDDKDIQIREWKKEVKSFLSFGVITCEKTQSSLFGEEKQLTGLLSEWTVWYCWRPTVIMVTSLSAFSSRSCLIRPVSWVMGLHWWNITSLGCTDTSCLVWAVSRPNVCPALSRHYVLTLYAEQRSVICLPYSNHTVTQIMVGKRLQPQQ